MKLRVSAVQYHLHSIDSFEAFAAQVEHYIRTADEFGSEYVLFPEFMTTQLMSIPGADGKARGIEELPDFTDAYIELFKELAARYNMYIIGGTHVVRSGDNLLNAAHLFAPDGTVSVQPKLHITPTEVTEWNMKAGDGVTVFDTPKARIAMLTCYDIEFPEIVRMVRALGADVIFCPSCTDDRQGFYRVRYCAHARTIENQIYVVTTGTVGSLPTVDFMRLNYGQAAVLAPNDIPFPPRGIMVEGEINNDMIVTADLDLSLLYEVRERGSVMTWRDRRTDLYTDWK
ncbi:carbon-nitrogen hydrolase family protein [Paenibacillus sp. PR3]|uniref:Carbon-nitrogen hydrolase family protein n=1 Tax=Paenibacillus terricola TaxID=2763503 RepID=A0ABR8N2K4_9BACL|nr:carbon-nitrogen hydrolase family protein [Paenibacillus terricola]MBD3922382.1 carbon-nitrogen hydrolase family protein [Paenibacillus terricola]